MVALAALPGCGETSDAPRPAPPAAAASEAPQSPVAFESAMDYLWRAESDSGSQAEFRLQVGDIGKASAEAVPDPYSGLLGVCEVDDQRDAAIPLHLSAKNTTPGFDLTAGVAIEVTAGAYVDQPLSIDAASRFNDTGDSCRELAPTGMGSATGVTFTDLAPGAEREHDWLLIVHNFYSPNNLLGDQESLEAFSGRVLADDGAGDFRTVCFTAPPERYEYSVGRFLSPGFRIVDTVIDPGYQDEPEACPS